MLLTPSQIHQVIKRELPAESRTGAEKTTLTKLSKLLEDSNLTAPEVLENLSSLLRSGETDGVRLRAAETALKLNGLLDVDTEKNQFSVQIIIKDSQFSSINPILIPR